MKQLIYIFLFFLFTGPLGANERPLDFKYIYAQKGQGKSSLILAVKWFNRVSSSNSLTLFSKSTQGNIQGLFADQMAIDSNTKTVILFKHNLKPDNSKYMYKILEHQNGYLYHGKSSIGFNYTLFFTTRDKNEVKRLVKTYTLQKTSHVDLIKLEDLWPSSLLFPNAYAEEVDCTNSANIALGTVGTSSLADAQDVSDHVRSQSFLQSSFACLGAAWDSFQSDINGVAQEVGDTATGIVTSIRDLFVDPARLWERVSTKAISLTNFISAIPGKMSAAIEGFKSLDLSIQKALACNFLGTLGASGAIALVTYGASSGRLAIAFSLFIDKFNKVKSLLEWLNKLPEEDKYRKSDQEALAKYFNKLSDEDLDMINEFSDLGLQNLARSAATCAI